MKIPKAFWLIICLSLISGCSGKSTPNEEKITITIEKPSQTAQKEKENAHDVSKSVSVSPEHKQKEKKPGSKTLRKPVAPTPSRLSKPAPQRSFNKPVQKNKLAKKMDFRSVAQRLNIDMHSKSEIVGYWKSIVGKSVTWGGVVYRVKAGR
ncbi:MAG TPA: hypothetical protein ENH52_04250, partial [Nitrospirae bacterium]|nr:hypothetical protein [Nitrospirota bacterium]